MTIEPTDHTEDNWEETTEEQSWSDEMLQYLNVPNQVRGILPGQKHQES